MKILFAADMSFGFVPKSQSAADAVRAMCEPAEHFRRADFSILNLENVFGNAQEHTPLLKNGPNLISDASCIEYLRALSPTAVGLANNHAKDYGEAALFSTMELLAREGYRCIGAGTNLDEAYRPAIFEKDGVSVAVIAACENEFGGATETESGTAVYRLSRVAHTIADARTHGSLPVIYFHGGHETYPFPSPARQELYRTFVELGAAAVICSHTHCPQGYEIYRGAPIVYGMGNFFFPASREKYCPSWFYGYLSELQITQAGIDLSVFPYRFDSDGVTMLTGQEKAQFDAYLAALNKPIASERRLRELFDAWCLFPSRFGYYRALSTFSTKQIADGVRETIPHLKNVFDCEAHNELLRNLMNMIYEERVEAAKSQMHVIEALQNMEIPE